MNVKIISDLSGEMQFDMSAENLVQLIGAATRYAADNSEVVTTHYANDEIVGQTVETIPEKKLEKPVSKGERMFGDYHSRVPISSVVPPMPAVRKPKQEGVYKGFLLIECEDCGKVRGFYAKNPQSVYYCDCGCQTNLEGLRPMFPKCVKCGSTFKYMTNVESPTLTYNCLDCGSPINLELNKRGDTFVTVGGRF